MSRKYSAIFQSCPVPGCEMLFTFYGVQFSHFRKHFEWEKAHGSIALFDEKGALKTVMRRKA